MLRNVYGTFATAVTFGGAFSPWLAGHLFDRIGNYFLPFTIAIISVGLACIMVWLAAPRKFRKEKP